MTLNISPQAKEKKLRVPHPSLQQEHRSAYPITSSSLNASHFPSWHSNSTVPLSNDFKLVEKTEHVHPVEAAKTVRQEGVITAKKA